MANADLSQTYKMLFTARLAASETANMTQFPYCVQGLQTLISCSIMPEGAEDIFLNICSFGRISLKKNPNKPQKQQRPDILDFLQREAVGGLVECKFKVLLRWKIFKGQCFDEIDIWKSKVVQEPNI